MRIGVNAAPMTVELCILADAHVKVGGARFTNAYFQKRSYVIPTGVDGPLRDAEHVTQGR
jgi:hypothetical protein